MDSIKIGSREGNYVIADRAIPQQRCGCLPQTYQSSIQRRWRSRWHGNVSQCTCGDITCRPYVLKISVISRLGKDNVKGNFHSPTDSRQIPKGIAKFFFSRPSEARVRRFFPNMFFGCRHYSTDFAV